MQEARLASLVLISFAFTACTPSPSVVETAIAKTQSAWTPTPAPTATLAPDSEWTHCILAKTMTKNYYEKLANRKTCVYGIVAQKNVLPAGEVLYDIFPNGEPITFLILVNEKKLASVFPGAAGILTTADAGDCIVVLGYPNPTKVIPLFTGVDVRDIPQLISLLGSSDATVQDISTLCK